jgi:hypothetical protein
MNREDLVGHHNETVVHQPIWGGTAALRDYLAQNQDADLREILQKTLIQLAALEDAVFSMAGGAAPITREAA